MRLDTRTHTLRKYMFQFVCTSEEKNKWQSFMGLYSAFALEEEEELGSLDHYLWFVDQIEKLIVILREHIHIDYEIEILLLLVYWHVILPRRENKEYLINEQSQMRIIHT